MNVGKREDALLDKISSLISTQRRRDDYCLTILAVLRHNTTPDVHPMVDRLILELGGAHMLDAVKTGTP